MTATTHNPPEEPCWVSCLRENFTSSSYGEELETGPAARSGTAPVPYPTARLSGAQAGGRARAFRRARMARFPSSRHTLHRGLRLLDLRKGDDSPLSASLHRDVPSVCHSRRLQTQRLLRCVPSGTFQTRLRPCADGSFSPWSRTCPGVHAAPLRS